LPRPDGPSSATISPRESVTHAFEDLVLAEPELRSFDDALGFSFTPNRKRDAEADRDQDDIEDGERRQRCLRRRSPRGKPRAIR